MRVYDNALEVWRDGSTKGGWDGKKALKPTTNVVSGKSCHDQSIFSIVIVLHML